MSVADIYGSSHQGLFNTLSKNFYKKNPLAEVMMLFYILTS